MNRVELLHFYKSHHKEKLYLKKELKDIHSKWEKENNVADRFGAKENREKMWQNFAASCQDLTDFQMIQEMI